MTHVSDVTNGASLEDSHTNFFALADLNQSNGMNHSNGISWKKLQADNAVCFEPLDDPVLSSYSKCLSAGILCVWRRVASQKTDFYHHNLHNETNQFNHSKELWVFWYGEEPDLTGLVGPNVVEVEQGSWESGLSYECRALLFKALHNLIEKCLLTKGFTRLGKFFIEPQCLPHLGASRSQIAFAFSFFVHGESTVCTSVDMRVAPSVYYLRKSHLQAALAEDHSVKVILSPYGLEGILTGQAYRSSDAGVSKMLSEWYSFYPEPGRKGKEENDMPVAVEVLIGGVRMKYPTSYVFVAEQDHLAVCGKRSTNNLLNQTAAYHSSTVSSGKTCPSTLSILTPPTSPERNSDSNMKSRTLRPPVGASWNHSHSKEDNVMPSLSTIVKRSVNEESSVQQHSETTDEATAVLWEFQEPSTVLKCSCLRKSNPSGEPAVHSAECEWSSQSSHIGKTDKSHPQTFTPFHKRAANMEVVIGEACTTRNVCSSSEQATSTSAYSTSQIKGFHQGCVPGSTGLGTLPQLHTPLTQPSSVDSHSNIPSVEANCSQICSSDPIMPTLSPHPKSGSHDVTFAHSPNADIGPTINIKEKPITDDMLSSFDTSLLTYFENAKSSDLNVKLAVPNDVPHETVLSSTSSSDQLPGLKRPVLPVACRENCEDEEFVMQGLLYDYSELNPAICEQLSRKRRFDAVDSTPDVKSDDIYDVVVDSNDSLSPCSVGGSFAMKDPYEFNDCDDVTPSEAFRQHVDVRIKDEERIVSPIMGVSPEGTAKGLPLSQGLATQDISPVSEDMKNITISSPPRNTHPKFIREEDLTVSVHDLDNIFDTSSSDNDDMFPVPSTHSKMSGTTDEYGMKSKGTNSGLLDLSRMYPTPPSLEQIAVPSPLGTNGFSDRAIYEDGGREFASGFHGSDKENAAVWILPERMYILESDKYSPLNNLFCLNNLLPPNYMYKPSWLQNSPMPIASNNMQNRLPDDSYDLNLHNRFLGNEEPNYNSVYPLDGDHRLAPLTNDIQSPPSNSSYLNKNLNSVGDVSMSSPLPEAHGLFVNLLLSDSMLNVFKDHNFDSCALCVCNMNIKGADIGINLPHCLMPYSSDEPQYKCSCGFSAVVYRHRSYSAGLFYEDEFEIAGFRLNDAILAKYGALTTDIELKKEIPVSSSSDLSALIDLIKVQCKSLCSSFSIFQKPDMYPHANVPPQLNALAIRDYCEVCFMALELGKSVMDNVASSKLDDNLKPACLHRWPYSVPFPPATSQEVMIQLDILKPMLQEAVHRRNTQRLWEVTYIVEGPLTWREFHRLVSSTARGTEDQCEPQPIPSVTVGYDKDYASLSPFALKYWDKLLLEPYSLPRDVAYIVVAPENEFIISRVKSFFRELSSMYELYKMGRHCPITKVLRDGIMRVGRNAATKLAEEPLNEWFAKIGDGHVANKLKLYARVCRHRLAPHLATLSLDKSLLETSSTKSEKLNSGSSPMPSSQDNTEQASKSLDADNFSDCGYGSASAGSSLFSNDSADDEGQEAPAIVIYIVEPFSFSSVDPSLYRIVAQGLLQCYAQMLEFLPDAMRNAVSLQLISLDSLLCMDKSVDGTKRTNELKSLVFQVFTQSHRLLPRQLSVKSLTGFGPAAAQDLFLSSTEKLYTPQKFYNQHLVLAAQKDKQTQLGEMFGDRQEKSGILYCSYCLTSDRHWILACCTNNNGELIETTVINITAPNRSRRKCAAVRRFGLQKLLEFILEVLSSAINPWRVIIGRLGHIGHGELRDWAALLSRKSLQAYNRRLRELCKQCSGLGHTDMPSILSICLVSVEPDTVLRIMPDQYTPDMHDSSSSCNTCHLSTPEDATCTHILVFPTSATMQSSQAASHQEHIDLHDDFFGELNDDDINPDINDIFKWTDMESPAPNPSNSPRRDNITHSASPSANGHTSPFHAGVPNRSMYTSGDCFDEPLQLLQQPLALGYYVSTAKTGFLPNWFWSSCPHLANRLPVFLKFALLIHLSSVQQNSDEIFHANAAHHNCHPLDSAYTTDVLRYVLEGYNALSWLSLDPSSHDRRSCLPIHIQILMQLYRIVETLL